MKTIIYTCPYVPAEWIAAHGLRACRLLLDRTKPDSALARAEGVCPFVRSFVGKVTNNTQAEGVVVTTVCDQMRRAFDIVICNCELPAFLMNVPSTWQSLESQKLYIAELKRLSRFLIRLGGKQPSNDTLANIMLKYDGARKSVLAAREYLSARRYAEAIAGLSLDRPEKTLDSVSRRVCKTPFFAHAEQRQQRVQQVAHPTKPPANGVRLAIIGGPMTMQDFDLFDMIEQAGGRIVLDATETGERGLCAAFDRRRLRDEPLMELANAYFGSINDASRRPNSELYKWLQQEIASRRVKGIIFHRYVWCDLWHAELQRLKDWSDLPVLDIDTDGNNDNEQLRTADRIRAFLEMLQ
jgi:benzoyl-CoA reductase/2-hydroxyglutaryl-CoA dehydratase subunit BcrC/BadD/HgdB